MAVALLVAAGRGERLGMGRPKALVSLAGRPLVCWSIETLQALAAVERIAVALPPGVSLDAGIVEASRGAGVVEVKGGATRSHSVREALRAVGPGDPVIVHDAARPLAPAKLFERALAALEGSDADGVIAASPVYDTIKELAADERTVARTLERSRLWAVQTPQVFRRETLERAIGDAPDELLGRATDDAWLIERAGGKVEVVRSGPGNIKVTTELDLRLAEVMLRG